LTEKLRVYQVAKDFNVSSEALLGILDGLGVPAKSHMSTLDPSVVDLVRQRFQDEKKAVQEEDARKQEVKAALERGAVEPKRPAAPATPPPSAPSKPAAPEPPREAPAAEAKPAPEAAEKPKPKVERVRRKPVDHKTVQDSVKKTLADLESGGKVKRFKKKTVTPPPAAPAPATPSSRPTPAAAASVATQERQEAVRIPELASVGELAEKLGAKPAEVISKLMGLGVMATQNQRLDKDTIEMVALEFGFTVEFETEFGEQEIEETVEEDRPEDLEPRSPVVTVMGHVDHGKTSLLDYVRKTNVVAGEKGGITQHIGAYEVELADNRSVTFLDTPGHQAFTAMRARGAQATDIVILVVAADDRVMPQTVEAIDHANAAEVPIVVAINKIDKPDANPQLVKQDLAGRGVLIEEFGGQVPCAEISAKKGIGVENLLELLLLQADILELKANPNRRARGVVIESRVEQGRGTVATVLVQNGTLHEGDPFVCGKEFGKVRAMANERGKRVKTAGPSSPVEVMGWSGPPMAGDVFTATETESQAKDVGQRRQLLAREAEQQARDRRVSLQGFHELMEKGEVKELRLIIKADVAGSVEVLADQLGSLGTDEVRCTVLHSGVGQITESDVLLADASNAVIIGFNVRFDPKAQQAAQRADVDVRSYNIIYEAVEDVKSALSGLLKPEEVERVHGRAEVRQTFRVTKAGTVAGCYILSGTVARSHRARLVRDDEIVFDGRIANLKRFKEDVREVAQGYECGISLEGHDDVREGDVIETYTIEEVARRI
jgi:translation initiation factor IF-2